MEITEGRIHTATETAKENIDLNGLMDTYSNMLLRIATLMLKDPRMAEDAVQETFLHLYSSFGNYRGEAGIKTYLSKILINECRQRRRSAWFRRSVPTAEMDMAIAKRAGSVGTESAIETVHDRLSLSEALMKLDAGSREVLLLYYYDDLSVTEISAALGRPEGTIKSRLKRGRDKLKSFLQEDLFDE
jgi:RNA polymerase sigma-70 factor (ECF subfamily)